MKKLIAVFIALVIFSVFYFPKKKENKIDLVYIQDQIGDYKENVKSNLPIIVNTDETPKNINKKNIQTLEKKTKNLAVLIKNYTTD